MNSVKSLTPAQIISLARTDQDMNMRDFAEALGVSHNMIALWERGDNDPSEERMNAWITTDTPWVARLGLAILGARVRRMVEGAHQPADTSTPRI